MNKKNGLILALCLTFFGREALSDPCEQTCFPQWMVRVRAVTVVPQVHSSIRPVGGYAHVSSTVIPEIDLSYFFTPNFAAEIIAGTNHHKVTAKTPIGKIKAGSVWMLPPALVFQYHHYLEGGIKPYVGVGPNYTFFYKEKSGTFLQNVHYKNNWGVALQGGIDFLIGKNFLDLQGEWYFNLDVKKIFLKTKVAYLNRTIKASVRLDPWLFGAGFGYRF